ncbi:MAG: hypothetical protein R2838_25060 [Caldilineaceae bacterium]
MILLCIGGHISLRLGYVRQTAIVTTLFFCVAATAAVGVSRPSSVRRSCPILCSFP